MNEVIINAPHKNRMKMECFHGVPINNYYLVRLIN